ncbi:hypothetical protein FI667_g2764, partial [Globisporangium splendens]
MGEFFSLSLSHNPLKTLSDEVGTNLSELRFLALENTQIDALPDWVTEVQEKGHKIYMYGTPFCASKSQEEVATTYGPTAVLTCTNMNPRIHVGFATNEGAIDGNHVELLEYMNRGVCFRHAFASARSHRERCFSAIPVASNDHAMMASVAPLEPLGSMKSRCSTIYSFIHVAFIILGRMVVMFHLLAVTTPRDNNVSGCKVQLYPWFTSKFACSVYEYNCYRHGTTSPSEDSLAFLDEKSLAGLVLPHCPELIVPKAIQRFKNLLGFEIWDLSIASWSKEAGLTQQTHPLITYVCLVVVNMSALSDGLLYDLPRELQNIEITRTNLSAVPDDLDVQWRYVRSLYLEYAQLTSVPPALTAMNIKDFSIVGNQVPSLVYPAPGNNGNGYIVLSLSKNPILELPDNIGNLSHLLFLALENTNLRQLPSWVSELQNKQGSKVFLHGTPFYNSKLPEDIDACFGTSAVVTCLDDNPRKFGRCPYEVVKSLQLP